MTSGVRRYDSRDGAVSSECHTGGAAAAPQWREYGID